MKKTKKAAVEVSFNWIFVLIAGGVILLFFINLVGTQKEKSQMNIALTVKTELKSIFTGATLSQARQLDIDIPQTTLNFICDFTTCTDFDESDTPSCYSEYSIGETGVNEKTPAQIIFAPSELYGKKILSWTLSWNIPFYVTNFLYITGTDIKYIFVGSSDSTNNFYNKFPEKTNKYLRTINTAQQEGDDGNHNFKFIFFDSDPTTFTVSDEILSSANPSNINAVKIDTSSKQISFYYFTDDNLFELEDYIHYISDSEAYASIFSDSYNFYKCNMQKAFNRLHLISNLLKARSEALYNDPQTPSRCKGTYDINNNGLSTIVENSITFFDSNILQISNSIQTLRSANKDTQEKSCTLIY